MNHVPEFSETAWTVTTKVPCLSKEPYDGMAFNSYPARRGWDSTLLFRGNFDQHPPAETADFLQNWLYFGALHEVLGRKANKATYMTQDDETQQHFVTTRYLNQHLEIVCERIRQLSKVNPHSATMQIQRIEQCLKMLSFFCTSASSVTSGEKTGNRSIWPLPPVIDLSIRMLGHHVASIIYHASFIANLPSVCAELKFGSAEFATSRMHQSGWCPCDVSMIAGQVSATTQYYASMLPRDRSLKDHSRCSEHTCLANQIDEDSYETKHVIPTCNCSHLSSVTDQIAKIIDAGGIPLVEISVSKTTQELELKTIQFRPGMQYIALSHVWSDGMGNVSSNSLPMCQLSELKSSLDELDRMTGNWLTSLNTFHLDSSWKQLKGRSPYFWLDTLCIPVSTQYKAQRKQAISMMGQIYNKAQRVLVLDAELQKLSVESSQNEIFLRLALSGWMKRLWTLQEAVMARQLYIKLRDGCFNLETDIEHSATQSLQGLQHPISAASIGKCDLCGCYSQKNANGNCLGLFVKLFQMAQQRRISSPRSVGRSWLPLWRALID